jgi:hypothetical protein
VEGPDTCENSEPDIEEKEGEFLLKRGERLCLRQGEEIESVQPGCDK